jgi:hypothetical protein
MPFLLVDAKRAHDRLTADTTLKGAFMFDRNNNHALSHSATLTTTEVNLDARDSRKEELRQLEDEAIWRDSHTKLVINYNLSSAAFWVLSATTLAFASMNANYGAASLSAQNTTSQMLAAVAIGLIFAAMELTVPLSAHLASWEGKVGSQKWLIRICGLVAFSGAVLFSLAVLQGKFASGADSSSARNDIIAQTIGSDQTSFTDLTVQRAELYKSVGARQEASFLAEISVLLSKNVGKKTVGDLTDSCTGVRKSAVEKDTCADVDALKRKAADAASIVNIDEKLSNTRGRLTGSVKTNDVVKSADAPDRVIASATGWKLDNIKMFKTSAMAAVAALVSHILWFVHGMVVNAAIAERRTEFMRSKQLTRSIERDERLQQAIETATVKAQSVDFTNFTSFVD